MTAALGVVCGIGDWKLAMLAAVATLLVLIIGLPIDRALYGRLGSKVEDNDLP